MQKRILIVFLNFFIFFLSVRCSEKTDVTGPDEKIEIHYVAIDIDDIFQPNWDSEQNKVGNIKMDASDVQNLVKLTHDLRSQFDGGFSFSLGFNLSYFDSAYSGDAEFLRNAGEFSWFDHLAGHEHIKEKSFTAAQIENLFMLGVDFEKAHGLSPYVSHYDVTPLHEGIWPPYDPLYAAFDLFGIWYTSSQALDNRATYGDVKILPRHFIGISSGIYSFSQISREKIAQFADDDFDLIMQNQATIFYMHQANFAKDRPGEALLRDLAQKLAAQSKYRIVFLPAQEVVRIAHETSLSAHKR